MLKKICEADTHLSVACPDDFNLDWRVFRAGGSPAQAAKDCMRAMEARLATGPEQAHTLALTDVTDSKERVLFLPKLEDFPENPHHILFDDGIGKDDAGIVDARGLEGEQIPFHDVKDVHLVRVEPYLAVKDDHYFVNLLNHAEKLLQVRIDESAGKAWTVTPPSVELIEIGEQKPQLEPLLQPGPQTKSEQTHEEKTKQTSQTEKAAKRDASPTAAWGVAAVMILMVLLVCLTMGAYVFAGTQRHHV